MPASQDSAVGDQSVRMYQGHGGPERKRWGLREKRPRTAAVLGSAAPGSLTSYYQRRPPTAHFTEPQVAEGLAVLHISLDTKLKN